MAKKKRPTYTLEFKQEAARLALHGDIPVSQVARDLGVSATALRRGSTWCWSWCSCVASFTTYVVLNFDDQDDHGDCELDPIR